MARDGIQPRSGLSVPGLLVLRGSGIFAALFAIAQDSDSWTRPVVAALGGVLLGLILIWLRGHALSRGEMAFRLLAMALVGVASVSVRVEVESAWIQLLIAGGVGATIALIVMPSPR